MRVPEISTPMSLGVILGILIVATVASLIKTRGAANRQVDSRASE